MLWGTTRSWTLLLSTQSCQVSPEEDALRMLFVSACICVSVCTNPFILSPIFVLFNIGQIVFDKYFIVFFLHMEKMKMTVAGRTQMTTCVAQFSIW